MRGVVSQHGGKIKNKGFAKHSVFRVKNTVYAWLLNSEWGDSFRKHLDLALAPNKTNEWVKKQSVIQQRAQSWHIIT